MSETLQKLMTFLMTFGPIALCFGIPLLGFIILFMGILILGSRKYSSLEQVVANAVPTTIANLKAGMGIVKIRGVIRQVAQPLWLSGSPPLAMLSLQINGRKFNREYGAIEGKTKTSPFLLDDGSGGIWIDAKSVDKRVFIPPSNPTPAEISDACEELGINHEAILRTSYPQQYQLWTWQQGDTVTVIGQVVSAGEQLTLGRIHDSPMLISPMEDQQLARHVKTSSGKMKTVTIAIAAILVFFLCILAAGILGLGRVFIGGA